MAKVDALPIFLLLVAACSGGGGSSGVAAFNVKITVGKGATVTLDRLTIEVPPGAVAADTVVQLSKTKLTSAAVGDQLGPAYATLPAAFPLLVPAIATYRYDGIAIPEGGDEANLQLSVLGPSGLPTFLPSTVNTNKTVSAPVSELTTFALVLDPPASLPDNGAGTLLFLRAGAGGLPDLWRAGSAGESPVLVTPHTPGATLSAPRLSTVANLAAFTETVGNVKKAWIVSLDGSNRTLVTPDDFEESAGDLDAAGTRLYVTTRAPGSVFTDLAVYNLVAGAPYARGLLTDTPDASEGSPRLSPDGETLVYQETLGELRRMQPFLGAPVKKVTTQPVQSFAWRPDGTKLVVERVRSVGGGFGEPETGGGLAEINPLGTTGTIGTALKGSGGARAPSYSPNGEQLLFEYFDQDPTVQVATIRQIPRKGLSGSIPQGGALLLGGASSVFPGGAPTALP